MHANFSFVVNKQQAGQFLLDCLLPCIPYLSAEQWKQLLLAGNIRIDGQTQNHNSLLIEGLNIDYSIADYQEAEVDANWKLLWSNHEISAVHKPANLPVNRTTRNVYNTLIQLLRRESQWPEAHLLHRLDIETSGIILIAHNNAVAKSYQPALGRLIKRKIYHAVVHEHPTWQTLEYECDLATLSDSAIRCQMHVVADGQGKKSKTGFKVLSRHNGFAVIECELFTGRKHQIRAHLASLGHPIVGDKIYAHQGGFYLKRLDQALTQADYKILLSEHHLLHAYELHLHNVWQQDGPDILIQAAGFPNSWQNFKRDYGPPTSLADDLKAQYHKD